MRNVLLAWVSRVRAWVLSRRVDDDFDREIDAHLELLAEDYQRRGLTPDDAARAARLEFRGVTQFKEAQRDRRGLPFVDAAWQDLRYAFRHLRQKPGYAAGAVLTLALGIGANTAVFSLLNGFLRPLPVRDPGQIVALAAARRDDTHGLQHTMSYPMLTGLRDRATVFSDLWGYTSWIGGMKADDVVSSFFYSGVTDNYFSGLGISPALGDWFPPGDGEHQGSDARIVLGHSFWMKRFGGNPGVLGKVVRLNGSPATIVGVVPKSFFGLYSGTEMDGYIQLGNTGRAGEPRMKGLFTDRTARRLIVHGRLKPGVSIEQAQLMLDAIARDMERANPVTDENLDLRVLPERLARPFPQRVLASIIPVITGLLLTLAGLVLLLACMNVANLVLVQATARQREMAVRAALGASRARLIRQAFTESVLLSTLGGCAGVLLGLLLQSAFVAGIDIGTDFPFMVNFDFDWRVFGYALAGVVLTSLTVGVLPAIRASRADASTMLHDAGRSHSAGAGKQRMRRLLVVGQVAGSLVLLIMAGLFVRRLNAAQHLDLGFDADRVLNVRIDPEHVGYSDAQSRAFFRDLLDRVRAWPEVQSASFAFSAPMGYFSTFDQVVAEERPLSVGERAPDVFFNRVSPSYFKTMGIPLLGGRDFVESDDEQGRPVAIVNHSMAESYWPGQDAVGKRFRIGSTIRDSTRPDTPGLEVVGVVRDSKYVLLFEDPRPYFYVPAAQHFQSMNVVQLRANVPPASLMARLQREVRSLEPDMPMADLQPMSAGLNGAMGFLMYRLGAYQAAAMGLLGLALATIGVYGVVSFGAAQRTREMGIRVALGAHPRAVLKMLLGQGVQLIVIGVIVGAVAAFALTRIVARFVVLADSSDIWTVAGISGILAVVAIVACYLPARRATKADPIAALRHE
jgi:predicted permease